MKFDFPNTPLEALPILKKQLESFGAHVHFETPVTGRVHSIAGQLAFEHQDGTLSIRVVKEEGHFTRGLLIGGIRQMVQEACELVRLGRAQGA